MEQAINNYEMITGYTGIQYGTIKIGGKSVGKSNEDIKHIGYLPENNPLYLDMPIIDYLQFCGELQGLNKDNLLKNKRNDELWIE